MSSARLTRAFSLESSTSLVDAIEAGVTYANVHTSKYPMGEIRGQISDDHGDHHGDDD